MKERIALEWVKMVFLPGMVPEDPRDWRLLVIDGHYMHTTVDFMWECFSNKVYIVFLPAHTSHILQPLDVGLFHPLKQAFQKHLHQLGQHDLSLVMAKKRFLYCYYKAREEVITEENIHSGWRAAGLWLVSRIRALGSTYILENHQNRVKSRQSGGRNSFGG